MMMFSPNLSAFCDLFMNHSFVSRISCEANFSQSQRNVKIFFNEFASLSNPYDTFVLSEGNLGKGGVAKLNL